MYKITYVIYVYGISRTVTRRLCLDCIEKLVAAILSRPVWMDGTPKYGAWVTWMEDAGECEACAELRHNSELHPMEEYDGREC